MWLNVLWCFVFVRGLGASDIILSEKYPVFESDRNVNKDVDQRIVGGEEANIEDYPYQVSFIVNNAYFCGGFIVSENYILTAAHCATNVDPTTVVLRAGSSNRKNGTIIPIAEVVPHPEYDNPPFDKDVAYMKTKEPIEFSDTIQPIALAPLDRPLSGQIEVAGWGRMQQGASSIPERLMKVTLPVVSYWPCIISYPTVLTRNMICAGNFFLGGKGTCQIGRMHSIKSTLQTAGFVTNGHTNDELKEAFEPIRGDSGGTAIQDNMAVGIVSFGRGCGQAFSPSVFADIAAPTIRNFIKDNTGL